MSLDVESVLFDLGVSVIRLSGDEVVAKCPMHEIRTGRPDSNPSWSINAVSLAHYCFSCGYAGSLSSLYRDLSGSVPEDLEWSIKKSSVLSAFAQSASPPEPVGPSVNEWVLSNSFRDMPQPLLDIKRLLRQSVDAFGIKWDPTRKMWVIPIRSPSGDLMGYQFRRKGSVLNHPKGMEKSKTLFGFHLVDGDRAVIVESPLDVVRLHGAGVPSIATFGAGISQEQLSIISRNIRFVVAGMDNDAAGKSANRVLGSLRSMGCVVVPFDYGRLGGAKDPGDAKSDSVLREIWESSLSLQFG
jgi:DNA primase